MRSAPRVGTKCQVVTILGLQTELVGKVKDAWQTWDKERGWARRIQAGNAASKCLVLYVASGDRFESRAKRGRSRRWPAPDPQLGSLLQAGIRAHFPYFIFAWTLLFHLGARSVTPMRGQRRKGGDGGSGAAPKDTELLW